MVIIKICLYILIAITTAFVIKSIVDVVKIIREGKNDGRDKEGC